MYYSKIKTDKTLASDIKYTCILLLLVSISVITPLLIGTIQTEKRIEQSNHYNIPALKPPVEYSAPDVFKPTQRRQLNTDPYQFVLENELKQRFFTNEGPSSVYGLLTSVDERTQSINQRGLENNRNCLGMDPVKIDINGWPMEQLSIWVQCYEILSNDMFIMFGRMNNTIYLYERGPATTLVAYINLDADEHNSHYPCCYQVNGGGDRCICDTDTEVCKHESGVVNGGNCRTIPDTWPVPTANITNDDNNNTFTLFDPEVNFADVNIYFSVGGYMTATQTGSRGLVHIESKPKSKFIQVAAAGIGLGFCGVQFVSNNVNIMAKGSMDGPGGTCLGINETCSTSDLELTLPLSNCTSSLGFSMIPLGRHSTDDFRGQFTFDQWQNSGFPGDTLNNVDISNSVSSSVNFGPNSVPQSLINNNRNF